MPHCIKTIPRAAFLEPSSLFIQAIAATQGVYSNVNIKNTKAVKGVNKVDNEEVFPPNNTVNVLTNTFLCCKSIINAVDILQSPKPNGMNKGDIKPPIIANKLKLRITYYIKSCIKCLHKPNNNSCYKNNGKCLCYKVLSFAPN